MNKTKTETIRQILLKHGLKALADMIKELKGFVTDIETDTKENKDFRRVLYTGKHSQLSML